MVVRKMLSFPEVIGMDSGPSPTWSTGLRTDQETSAVLFCSLNPTVS